MNGCYRFAIGSFACTSLLDGSYEYRWQDFYSTASETEARAAMKSKGISAEKIVTPYTYLHVDTGEHQVLLDAGAGSLAPTTGRLPQSMQAAEIDPDEIDTVILSHAHPDHIGGLLRPDGSPAFPKATYYIWKREWDYWFSDEERARAHETPMKKFDGFFDFARSRLQPVRKQVRLVEFSGERESIMPGISVLRAPGHTPGHMVVELRSGAETLVYIGDTVLSPLHLEHLDWLPVYDIQPEQAAVSKRFVFDLAAAHHAWVATA